MCDGTLRKHRDGSYRGTLDGYQVIVASIEGTWVGHGRKGDKAR